MGWYDTCGFSDFPIEPGTKVRLFILGQGRAMEDGRAGFSYATGLWSPLGLGLQGTYDDEHVHGALHPTNKAYRMKRTIVGGLVSEEILREMKVPPVDNEFLKKLDRGKASCWQPGSGNAEAPLGQMLVREDVWTAMLRTPFMREWDQKTVSIKDHYIATDEWLENAWLLDGGPAGSYEVSRKFEQSYLETEFAGSSGIIHSIYEGYASAPRYKLYLIMLLAKFMKREIGMDEAQEVLRAIADLYHVNALLDPLRLAWRPQPGRGSQSIDWKMHHDFKAKLVKLADRALAREAREED